MHPFILTALVILSLHPNRAACVQVMIRRHAYSRDSEATAPNIDAHVAIKHIMCVNMCCCR